VACSNHPVVLGENNANLPRIVAIVAEAFQHEALSVASDVGARMLNIARLVRVISRLTLFSVVASMDGPFFCVAQNRPSRKLK